MSDSRDKRLLWVTNLAAPYRLPVWEELGRHCTLRVGLLESTERLRRDSGANRGSDWAGVQGTNYRIVEYGTARLARGENRHYTLTDPHAVQDLAGADAVLLGGWDSPAYWQLLGQAKIMGKATLGFYESTLASQGRHSGVLPAARARFFRALDRVVVPGPAAGEAIAAMGVEPERILTGFNAVDVQAFAAASHVGPHEGHRFLYVGQLIERKNLRAIIEAFVAAGGPQDTLTLVGRGDQRAELQALVARRGAGDRVHFIDYLPYAQLPEELSRHDTLVLASHVEVWGLVVNEALAAGLQAIVTENCGVARSVRGMEGVLVGGLSDLAAMMSQAKSQYRGPIGNPQILQHTPEAFAAVFADALEQATNAHR